MFTFLKEKLKRALSIFSRKAEEVGVKEESEDPSLTAEEPVPKKAQAEKKESVLIEKQPKAEIPNKEPLTSSHSKKMDIPKKESDKKSPTQSLKPASQIVQPKPNTKQISTLQKGTPQSSEPKTKEPSFIKADRERAEQELKAKKNDISTKQSTKPKEEPQAPQREPFFPEEPLEVPKPETKSSGFFSRIFGKKEPPKPPEPIQNPKTKIQAPEPILILPEKPENLPEKPEKKPSTSKLQLIAPPIEPPIPSTITKEPDITIEEEATGFFGRLAQKIVTTKISEKQFEDLFYDLELAMLENNTALEVIGKIKQDLKQQLVDKPIRRGGVENAVASVLKRSIQDLFVHESSTSVDLIKMALSKKESSHKPLIICLFGINGSGKTTTIAKLARIFLDSGLEPVIAAADTFRAAAIDQLEEHGSRLGVKVIKHEYGADAAAVAFDAIKHAESKGKDVVLIDTAGRMQTNVNLMDEMKKIIRVAKPDVKIFIGESIAGNDCIEQATTFNAAVGIDGIILSKADVDEKGGAAISVSYVTKKPILYLGVGQEYKDLIPFSSKVVIEGLGL